jgi:hypothetical protein
MQLRDIGAPASTDRQPLYYPPCVDLWDTVYPTELMVCRIVNSVVRCLEMRARL